MGKAAGDIAFYAYIVPFLVSTVGGSIIAGIIPVSYTHLLSRQVGIVRCCLYILQCRFCFRRHRVPQFLCFAAQFAVSYTHLDVYKRQLTALRSPCRLRSFLLRLRWSLR